MFFVVLSLNPCCSHLLKLEKIFLRIDWERVQELNWHLKKVAEKISKVMFVMLCHATTGTHYTFWLCYKIVHFNISFSIWIVLIVEWSLCSSCTKITNYQKMLEFKMTLCRCVCVCVCVKWNSRKWVSRNWPVLSQRKKREAFTFFTTNLTIVFDCHTWTYLLSVKIYVFKIFNNFHNFNKFNNFN
jgi:hypothetical protein